MNKKRHHYIPKAYLKFFCDEEGMVYVYPKDTPGKFFLQAPDSTGFHKYYYSQPMPEGGTDHNTLENLFSQLESKWPTIVERLKRREDVNDSLEDIFAFMGLQRVRVPASRDAMEKADAEMVKTTLRALDAAGKLPPKPRGFEDILDRVDVSIDPHRSIHAMAHVLRGLGQMFNRMGIGALHNATDIPFLTSDNPIVWFDPSMPEAAMQPYVLRPGGAIVLLFPVTPRLMIYGHSSMKDRFASEGLGSGEIGKRESVKMMNRQICRFAYKAVFAQAPGQDRLIEKYASLSPVLQTTAAPAGSGQLLLHRMVFGRRQTKPKWHPRSSETGEPKE
jgi:hypothetical protein